MLRSDAGDVRWSLAFAPDAELAALVRALPGGPLPPQALPIKEGARRSVWALPGPAGGVLAKRFALRGADPWRALFVGSRAAAEYRTMERLVRLGAPVVRPLGFGERRRAGLVREAWFLGRLVPGARTLRASMGAARRAGDGAALHALLDAALASTAALHGAGGDHRDLHADNLLVDAAGRVLVTDLHSVSLVRRLPLARRAAGLAELAFSLRALLEPADLLARLRGPALLPGEDGAALVRETRRALARFEADYLRGRTRRCTTNSSGFVVVRGGGGRTLRRRDYEPARLAADLEEHARHARQGGARRLWTGAASVVTRCGPVENGVVVKESTRAGPLAAARNALGCGRLRAAWVGARRLQLLGIATPETRALVERRDGTALLVTAAHDEARMLREVLQDASGTAALPDLAAAVGHLLGRLAAAGFRHADLSTKNLLVSGRTGGSPSVDLRGAPLPHWPSIMVIDLDGWRRVAPHDGASLRRMLGQLLDIPRAPDRALLRRFLRGYRQGAGRGARRADLRAGWAAALARRRARRAAGSTTDDAPR